MAGLTQLVNRNTLIDVNSTVQLVATFTDQFGTPTDTDSLPTVSIVAPSGLVVMTPTTAGVMRLSAGKYQFDFLVPFNGPYGIWNDIWNATISGFPINSTFQFVVVHSDQPAINSDGYVHAGDDPGLNYSQIALMNINKLMKTLRARLNSRGKAKSVDQFGNTIYVDCDIFSVDQLIAFIANALSDFNQVPYFTFFTFEDTQIIDQFHDILVEGATLTALVSQALIERGREFQLNDNGTTFTPPTMSELMQTQYATLLTNYWEKLRYIKNSMRPSPIAIGVAGIGQGINPAMRRLQHVRARRII